MGVVKMKETGFLSRGYTHCTATLYVYCDKCGSFDIETYLGPRKWLLLVSSFGFAAAVMIEVYRSRFLSWAWVLLGLITLVVTIKFLWGDKDYRCRKCASTPSTRYNTMGFPSDIGLVDVPDDSTERRYLDYWPDECDLDDWLKPPPIVAA